MKLPTLTLKKNNNLTEKKNALNRAFFSFKKILKTEEVNIKCMVDKNGVYNYNKVMESIKKCLYKYYLITLFNNKNTYKENHIELLIIPSKLNLDKNKIQYKFICISRFPKKDYKEDINYDLINKEFNDYNQLKDYVDEIAKKYKNGSIEFI